jgi:hypothetical protein
MLQRCWKCSPFCSNHKRTLRLTPLIAFCNINLYTNKCIDSKRPTDSIPAPTLITNSMYHSILYLYYDFVKSYTGCLKNGTQSPKGLKE